MHSKSYMLLRKSKYSLSHKTCKCTKFRLENKNTYFYSNPYNNQGHPVLYYIVITALLEDLKI